MFFAKGTLNLIVCFQEEYQHIFFIFFFCYLLSDQFFGLINSGKIRLPLKKHACHKLISLFSNIYNVFTWLCTCLADYCSNSHQVPTHNSKLCSLIIISIIKYNPVHETSFFLFFSGKEEKREEWEKFQSYCFLLRHWNNEEMDRSRKKEKKNNILKVKNPSHKKLTLCPSFSLEIS